MLAYRRDERAVSPADIVRSLKARVRAALTRVSHDDMRSIFIDFGEFEAGVTDSIFPHRDGLHPLATTFRRGALAAAHALLGSWQQDRQRTGRALTAFDRVLDEVAARDVPDTITIRVSEGYAYYALHPETYAVAADRFAADRRPPKVVCLGIRSIGTSLSGVVAAALEHLGTPVETHTVRPHGHPFDRQVEIAEDLANVLRSQRDDCHFAIVDEGPGLSGSSFTSVVRALRALGIDGSRIAMFPSWNADPANLRSQDARQVWTLCRSYTAAAEDAGFGLGQISDGERWVDLSGGLWRRHLLGEDERHWPAVQPQHEVPKAWIRDRRSIVRFAGLGRYGAAKRQRAERLASAGLGAVPESLEGGFLTLSFIPGTPCGEVSAANPALIDRIAEHVAFLVREFPASRSPSVEELEEMTTANLHLGVGDVDSPDLLQFRSALRDAPCAAIDGRMLPCEWVDDGGRYWKVDALDHHADHFYPGVQDAGWDLAAAAFEFSLQPAAVDRLITAYVAASGDRDVRARLAFYAIAYPAFRLGYATLARHSVKGTADAVRFERLIARCLRRLRELVTLPSAP